LKARLLLKNWVRRFGYEFHALPLPGLTLRDLGFDLPHFVLGNSPVVFDIGANKGQTIDFVQEALPGAKITAFEPNPELAATLKRKYSDAGVIESCAVGAEDGHALLHAMDNDELSSLLNLSRGKGNPFSETRHARDIAVRVTTVDNYLLKRGIPRIGLLKIDTQGFDLDVLRGALTCLNRKIIDAVLVEVNFIEMYTNQCTFGEIERYLAGTGYGFVNLYEVVRTKSCIQWATALFTKQ
jgi:FkbM family methyltransferase